jgi:hypothetical protein
MRRLTGCSQIGGKSEVSPLFSFVDSNRVWWLSKFLAVFGITWRHPSEALHNGEAGQAGMTSKTRDASRGKSVFYSAHPNAEIDMHRLGSIQLEPSITHENQALGTQ